MRTLIIPILLGLFFLSDCGSSKKKSGLPCVGALQQNQLNWYDHIQGKTNDRKGAVLECGVALQVLQSSQAGSSGTGTGTSTGTGTGTATGTGTGSGTAAPSGLTYSGSPFSFTKDIAITTQTPVFTGTVTSCTASPTLPAGISIDSSSCALSGTPTASQAATSYTITATNSGGSTTATISITIANPTYSIGGSISGLTASGLVLQNSAADSLTVAANSTSFSFNTKVTGVYSVTVKTNPTGLLCSVTSSSGTASADVTNVNISCASPWTRLTGVASGTVEAFGIIGDTNGNLYVTGRTDKGLDGNSQAGSYDLFVVKYDALGTKKWTKQMGVTSAATYPFNITTDSSNNIYIVGRTNGDLDSITRTGSTDMFIIKFDSDGNKQWTRLVGVASRETSGMGIKVDSNNNIYITGSTTGSLYKTAAGLGEKFIVAKYDSNGTKVWADQYTLDVYSTGRNIVLDWGGNVYIIGFTSGVLDGVALTGSYDTFIMKYNSTGTKQWTKMLGANGGQANPWGLDIDSNNNIYISGEVNAAFAGNTKVGNNDMFVAKYDTSGTFQWVKQEGLTGIQTFSYGVVVDSSGNSYAAGRGGIGSKTGLMDAFVVKFDTNGTKQWSQQLGVTNKVVEGRTLYRDASGIIYTCGFTNTDLESQTKTGTQDLFVSTKLNP